MKALTGGDIGFILRNDPHVSPIFAGFAFPDNAPEIKTFPAIAIINTDLSTGPGEHWCAAFVDSSKHCEYFDPLGVPPNDASLKFNLTPLLQSFCDTLTFIPIPVQTPGTVSCGHHCIYFCLLRARGFSLKTILNHFYVKNTLENDAKVTQLVLQYGLPS